MRPILITSLTCLGLSPGYREKRGDHKLVVAEREGLDVPALLFDDQLFPKGEDGSHNILACQLPADEIGNPMDIDVTVRVHLSDKRDLPLGQRETKVSFGVPVGLQSKPPREMSHTSPLTVSNDSRKPGPLLLAMPSGPRPLKADRRV